MHCYFCQQNQKDIDFKQIEVLNNFLAASGKIKKRRKTGLCRKHQSKLAQAVKRARFMALLPYVRK